MRTQLTDDLDILDEAHELVGHIPDPISDYLEWLFVEHPDNAATRELRRLLKEITR